MSEAEGNSSVRPGNNLARAYSSALRVEGKAKIKVGKALQILSEDLEGIAHAMVAQALTGDIRACEAVMDRAGVPRVPEEDNQTEMTIRVVYE